MKKNEKTTATTVAKGANIENIAPKTATTAEQTPTTAEQPTPQAEPTAPKQTPPATPDKEKTLDEAKQVLELSKRIEELEAQLRKEPQTIEERIEYYERKQVLTERYKKLHEQVRNLDNLREQVAEENIGVDDFNDSNDYFRLKLLVPSYGEKSAFVISNQALIECVLDLLRNRMLDVAENLQKEIAA